MLSLSYLTVLAYISDASLLAMAINGTWNKRCGPGGSTRHLHQPFLGGPIQTTRLRRFVIGTPRNIWG